MSFLDARKRKLEALGKGKSAQPEAPKLNQQVAVKVADTPVPERDRVMQLFDTYKPVMEGDLTQLKSFEKVEDKLAYKREVLQRNEYLQYINDYVTTGANHPNMVLVWVFIWLVDLKDWPAVFRLLPTLVEQEQKMPTGFNTKNWLTFVCDYLYDAAAIQLEAGRESITGSGIVDDLKTLARICDSSKEPPHPICHGKVYAILAKLERACGNQGYAYEYAVKAEGINTEGAGVKKLARDVAKVLQIESAV